MRRLLPLILLTTLTTAHAAFCIDVPGADRTMIPVFQGSPRQVIEERRDFDTSDPVALPSVTTRTFTLQGGRLVKVHMIAPGREVQSVLTLTGTAGYQRGLMNPAPSPGAGNGTGRADVEWLPRMPITVQFDAKGRLTNYSGVAEDGPFGIVKNQVSCIYSAAKRQVVEKFSTSGGSNSILATAQMDERGRLIRLEMVSSLNQKVFDTRQTTYTYAPDGTSIRVDGSINGQPRAAMLMTTDAAGRVTHIEMADLGDVQEQWQIEYDARGNWVRQIGTMQGQTFMTITRRITY